MPAINLLRLRAQLTELLWVFTDPFQFKEKLEAILDQYSVTSYRPGADLVREVAAPEKTVPLLVLRELDLALAQPISEHPAAAFTLCEELWNDKNLELHTVATRMLGMFPAANSARTLQFIEQRMITGQTAGSIRIVIENSTLSIRRTDPEILMNQLKIWCADASPQKMQAGIYGLIILANDTTYENLPAIFSALEHLFEHPQVALQQDYIELIEKLLERSQVETSFFVRQMEETRKSEITARVFRKILPHLSEPSRSAVQASLKENRK